MAAMGVKLWQLPRIAVHMRHVALQQASPLAVDMMMSDT
jgi:hypothetical protein